MYRSRQIEHLVSGDCRMEMEKCQLEKEAWGKI
jgi:hypothetical protein